MKFYVSPIQVWAADLVSFGRAARRPWGDHLPTDALLVFSLFSAYMDSQLTSNPLVVSCRSFQDISFTNMYRYFVDF